MARKAMIILVAFLGFGFLNQQPVHEATVINIEVPVRVFEGYTFIDNLIINDFEVYEDGVLQKIEAIYRIAKKDIKMAETSLPKKEIKKESLPKVTRHFILMFELTDYIPKIKDTLDYFLGNVYTQEDTLLVVTPLKSFALRGMATEARSKDQICKEMNNIIRKDIKHANREYRDLLRDLILYRDMLDEEELSMLNIKMLEADLFRKVRDYKYFDERKLFLIADYFKKLEGQKHIFLFYQKEELPIPPELDRFEPLKDASLDVMKVRQAFSDSTVSVHFVFVTKKAIEELDVQKMRVDNLPLADVSAQIFNAFREIAESTGGTISASANLSASFQRAVDATESYYLLYYSPLDYKKNGKFRKIEVKIKDRNYRILHREGYFSN